MRGSRRIAVLAIPVVAVVAASLLLVVRRPAPAAPPERTPVPTAPPEESSATPSPAATPLPTPTPTPLSPTATPFVYRIDPVEPPGALGILNLSIANLIGPVPEEPVDPADLRLPAERLRPQTGRFGEIRGTYRLTHLGSDYVDPGGEDPLAPPSENAILAAAVYLERSTYTAIAVDMSGNVQMYLLTLDTDAGPRQYLYCFAHLSPGSNEEAIAQAQGHGGHVAVMGYVTSVSPENPALSDMHIGVIDVAALLDFTGRDTLYDALVELFSDRLPRTNQAYPSIFVEPESVYPALQAVLDEYTP
jgi:hypothetical protein